MYSYKVDLNQIQALSEVVNLKSHGFLSMIQAWATRLQYGFSEH